MKGHRLRAPSTDGALLAVPPLEEADAQFNRTARALASWDYDFQGRRAGRLRAQVHREVIAGAKSYLASHGLDVQEVVPPPGAQVPTPLIVTGHQPELFHLGVWVKNFATAALASMHGGLGLNLIVDNDLPKSATIRVPQISGGKVRTTRIEFDEWKGEAPYEDLAVHDEQRFASFGDRALDALNGGVADPIIADYWPRTRAFGCDRLPLGLRLALARRSLEHSWGVSNLEIPLSQLCKTEGFLWFASHLLAQLPRVLEIHNRALDEYRARYRIRSKNHPVSALAVEGDWLEAPF